MEWWTIKRFEHSLNVTSQGGIVFSTIVQHIHARIWWYNIYDEFITPIIEENKNKLNKVESKT